ncbi:hypothetical protein [Clostridium beijerinckii]|nr:hypothetical protein [Clostridium beijerinckii]
MMEILIKQNLCRTYRNKNYAVVPVSKEIMTIVVTNIFMISGEGMDLKYW